MEKFPSDNTLYQVLEILEGVKCIDLKEYLDGETVEEMLNGFEEQPKIVITYPNIEYSNGELIVGRTRNELRYIMSVRDINETRWTSEVYMRHGGHFEAWYYTNRNDVMMRQIEGIPVLDTEVDYLFLYVRDFDHFVTSNFDPDVPQVEDDDTDIPLGDAEENIIPTTDAGEVHYEVDDDMELKGFFGI